MGIKSLIHREIKRYGQKVCLCTPCQEGEKGVEFNAIITPLRYKNKMYLEGDVSSLGYVDQSHYLYIGPVEHDLTKLEGDSFICTLDGCCTIKKSEKVYFKNKPLYIWAVLQKSGGEAKVC